MIIKIIFINSIEESKINMYTYCHRNQKNKVSINLINLILVEIVFCLNKRIFKNI